MKLLLLTFSVIASFCGSINAQTSTYNCENRKNNTSQNQEKLYKSLLKKGIDHGFPGFILGIKQGKNAEWIGSVGKSDIENDISMKINDRFHIASVTKIFTAAAVLILIDDGKLSLNTEVISVLDPKLLKPIPYIDQITVAELLDHSSGIYGFNNDKEYIETWLGSRVKENFKWTPEKLVALSYGKRVKPFGKPKTGNYYSDTNYVLLGMIVEKVSGMSLRNFVRKKIFKPLKLKNTAYFGEKKNQKLIELPVTTQGYLKRSKIIDSFVTLDSGFKLIKEDLVNTTRAGEKTDAAAAIVSTAGDLLKFGTSLYSGKLLSKDSLRHLLAAAKDLEKESKKAHRQSITSVYKGSYGVLFASVGDGPGGINAVLAFHPETKTLIVGFTNIFGLFDEAEFIRDEVIKPIISEKQKCL